MATNFRALVVPLVLSVVAACSSGEASEEVEDHSRTEPTTLAPSPTTEKVDPELIPLPRPPGERQVGVRLTEYRVETTRDTVPAGEVEFHVVNGGTTMHLFVIRNSEFYEITPHLPPGGSSVLTVELEPGEYQILCTVRDEFDHYSEGMNGHIVVR